MATGEDALISLIKKPLSRTILVCAAALMALISGISGQTAAFRGAPSSSAQTKNPYAGDAQAAAGGKKLYSQNCSQCHGNNLQGIGPAPALTTASVKSAAPGELFWFITNGDLNKGMPSWSQLPKQQRWQIVTFLESKNEGK
jgi:mono/diheme cytochrome c family protein